MATKALPVTENEAASYFFELFNANIIPMATWKYDGTFTFVNDAFLKLIGYTKQDFESGKVNWRTITPKEYQKSDEQCVQELKASGHANVLVKEYLHKDGSRVRVKIYNFIINKTTDHGLGIFLPA